MPLPTPKEGETLDRFISRCMANEAMKSEFAKTDRRLAVCHDLWKKSKGKRNSEPAIQPENF